jgi:protein-L-isoaspartate O-methyltransferase
LFLLQDILGAGYVGHRISAEYLHKHAKILEMEFDCRILDVGAGSGLAGMEVSAEYI